MSITRKDLLERFSKLPITLQEAIFSAEITDMLLAIGKKYGLLLDRIDDLLTETHKVMLGMTHPNQYISNLQQTLGIERDVARSIAQEINAEVFAKIREELKTLHNIKEEEKEDTQKPPPAPTQKTQEEPAQKELPKTAIPSTPPPHAEQTEPYAHKDLAPLPPPVKKSYTFSELQKQQSGMKETNIVSVPPKPVPPAPPILSGTPAIPKQETHAQAETPPPKTLPQQPSPFEAKIKKDMFRQAPTESTKEEKSGTPINKAPTNDNDPYRQAIAPEEMSFTINPHITKDK
ncbi:MAG: hypothetical protein Q8O83_00045 [bacterium]|nr:hypothetical protein [bacterium]